MLSSCGDGLVCSWLLQQSQKIGYSSIHIINCNRTSVHQTGKKWQGSSSAPRKWLWRVSGPGVKSKTSTQVNRWAKYCAISKTWNTSGIKCQQPEGIKGGDIQWGTFYHLEASVEAVKVSLRMLLRAKQGQAVIITLTPCPAGSDGIHLREQEELSYTEQHRGIEANGNVTGHSSINNRAKDL